MWPPGAYKPTREALPYPPYGTLNFFDEAARHVLDGIKKYRGTAIRPQRTGPVIDVLYSAAGNSADEAYYTRGIIGYDFEIGDTAYYKNPTTGVETTCNPGQQPPFGASTNPCLENEGFDEAMEFSDGNYGLLQSAFDYSKDVTPPTVTVGPGSRSRRRQVPGALHSPARRRRSTTRSTARRPRRPPPSGSRRAPARCRCRCQVAAGQTLKWIATDFKGNLSAVRPRCSGPPSTCPAPSAAPCRRRWP